MTTTHHHHNNRSRGPNLDPDLVRHRAAVEHLQRVEARSIVAGPVIAAMALLITAAAGVAVVTVTSSASGPEQTPAPIAVEAATEALA